MRYFRRAQNHAVQGFNHRDQEGKFFFEFEFSRPPEESSIEELGSADLQQKLIQTVFLV